MKRNQEIEQLLKQQKAPAPDPTLKQKILSHAQEYASVSRPRAVRSTYRKPLPAVALVALIALLVCTCSLSAAGLYLEDYESVYVDTNPSVELVLNRFERIHKVIYHNEDAKSVFADTKLKGLSAEEGIALIIDTLGEKNYLTEDTEICISTGSKKGADTQKLLEKVTGKAKKQAESKGYKTSFTAQKLSKQESKQAKEQGIPPAKLKRIVAIRAIDPTLTEDELAQMSMKELSELYKKLSQQHKK